MAEGVSAINQAIDARDEGMLMPALTNPSASIHGVTSQCIQKYLDKLANLKDKKKLAGWCLNCLLTLNSPKSKLYVDGTSYKMPFMKFAWV